MVWETAYHRLGRSIMTSTNNTYLKPTYSGGRTSTGSQTDQAGAADGGSYDWSALLGGLGAGLAYTGGIAGALGSGGPQAMTNFVNKIAAQQNLELSQRWESFQTSQARSHQLLRDEAQRAHERGMQAEGHRLKQGTAATKSTAALLATITSSPVRRAALVSLVGEVDPKVTDAQLVQLAVAKGLDPRDSMALIDTQVRGAFGTSFNQMVSQGGFNPDTGVADIGTGKDGEISGAVIARTGSNFNARLLSEQSKMDGWESGIGSILTVLQNGKDMSDEQNSQLVVRLDNITRDMVVWGESSDRLRAMDDVKDPLIHTEGLPHNARWQQLNNTLQALTVSAEHVRDIVRNNNAVADMGDMLQGDPESIATSSIVDPLHIGDDGFNNVFNNPKIAPVLNGFENTKSLLPKWVATSARLGVENNLTGDQIEFLADFQKVDDTLNGQLTAEIVLREIRAWRKLALSGDPHKGKALPGALFGSLEEAAKFMSMWGNLPTDRNLIQWDSWASSHAQVGEENTAALTSIIHSRSLAGGQPINYSGEGILPSSLTKQTAGLSYSDSAFRSPFRDSSNLAQGELFNQAKFDIELFWRYHSEPANVKTWLDLFMGQAAGEDGEPASLTERHDRAFNLIDAIGGRTSEAMPIAAGQQGFKDKLSDLLDVRNRGSANPAPSITEIFKRAIETQPQSLLDIGIGDTHMRAVKGAIFKPDVTLASTKIRGADLPKDYEKTADIAAAHRPEGGDDPMDRAFDNFQVGDFIWLGLKDPWFARVTGGVNESDSMPNNNVKTMMANVTSSVGALSKEGFFHPYREEMVPRPEGIGASRPRNRWRGRDETQAGYSAQRPVRYAIDLFMQINVNEMEDRESAAQIQLFQNYIRKNSDTPEGRKVVEVALFGHAGPPTTLPGMEGWLGGQRSSKPPYPGRTTVPFFSDIGFPVHDVLGSKEDYEGLRVPPVDPGVGESGTATANPMLSEARLNADRKRLVREMDTNVASIRHMLGITVDGMKAATPATLKKEQDEYTFKIAEIDAMLGVIRNPARVNHIHSNLLEILAGPGGGDMIYFGPTKGKGKDLKLSGLMTRLKKAGTGTGDEGLAAAEATLVVKEILREASVTATGAMMGSGKTRVPRFLEKVLANKSNVAKIKALFEVIASESSLPGVGSQEPPGTREALGRYLNISFGQAWEEIAQLATEPGIMKWELERFNPQMRDKLGHIWPHLDYEGEVTLPGSSEYSGEHGDTVGLAAFNRALVIYIARLGIHQDSNSFGDR